MNTKLQELPVEERIRIVEDLWDSIAAEQKSLRLTSEQKEELDRRIDVYEADGNRGRLVPYFMVTVAFHLEQKRRDLTIRHREIRNRI